jgi:hypothetical protein
MSHNEHDLGRHHARLASLWERMVGVLGVYTVNVLLERAIWQASKQYPELALIKHDDTGLSLDALSNSRTIDADAAVSALYSEMLLVLARLLGKDMAGRLLAELDRPDVADG